ncbi:TylF/MycF/NovP-related O-methyltransferase [Bradyrhizobium sp. WD16]|uniref:TylF/MycF/NovP-related O-methyltransferase n=1 Tax=Bradyrhizobium sp. WD16 TaxID=1521768 RepID=UPI0020A5340C|nr:TylF/MycF/NovP-related O-methyltransferase [Bradyrhizobium sp. WD16]
MNEALPGMQRPPLHVVVPVWGDAYLDTFLDYSLPAQLSSGNIPAVPPDDRNRYTIYTTAEGYRRSHAHPAVRQLATFIRVEFKPVEALTGRAAHNKYHTKSKCYAIALNAASEAGAAVAMLNADILLADGFLRAALRLVASGKRVVEVTGSRGLQDPIKATLDRRFRDRDGAISISPAQLSGLWLENLHPQLAMHSVDGPEGGSFHPSHLYWLVGKEGVIIRGFHLYPIVVRPHAGPVRFSGTIDDDLVALLAATPDERVIIRDTTDLFCCELSPAEHPVDHVATRGDRKSMLDFYARYRAENIANLETEIVISNAPPVGELWDLRRRESSQFVEGLVSDLRRDMAPQDACNPANAMKVTGTALGRSADQVGAIEDEVEFIKAVGEMLDTGQPIPFELEERSLLIHLKSYPDRADLLQRLCTVHTLQGKPVPLDLEERTLVSNLTLEPDRADLLERLRIVQVALGKTAPPAPALGRSGEQASQTDIDFQREAEDFAWAVDRRDMDTAFSPILELSRRFTMTSVERTYALYQSVRYIEAANIPGAIVECGVWRGGSIMVALATLKALGRTERDVYLFDTFEGLPRPDEDKDIDVLGNRAIDGWLPHARGNERSNWAYASLEDVRANIGLTGYPLDRVHFIKGMVESTLPGNAPGRIALCRLDTDWYASTRHEMIHLYPRLSVGGVLIIDDYGHFRGARQAVDEYLAETRTPLLLNRIDYSGRLAIKPQPPGILQRLRSTWRR